MAYRVAKNTFLMSPTMSDNVILSYRKL